MLTRGGRSVGLRGGVGMAKGVRFDPAECPGCGSPVEARYTQYRDARRPLFGALLAAGLVATFGLVALSLWATFYLPGLLLEGDDRIARRERGVLHFLAFVATLPVIAWLTRRWWRALDRLPRTFGYECGTCRWAGPCRVAASRGGA
ncbi:MAG: hypothetical protein C0501_24485 [Isosphaera sp.]|nr:hypothetical protein [Isosphaera sp.]